MAKQVSDGTWACEYPGCTYTNTKEGYVRNHEKLKHGGDNNNKAGKTGGTPSNKDGAKKCPDCKGSNVRLLNSSNSQEKTAKLKGYRYICDDCEEVFK